MKKRQRDNKATVSRSRPITCSTAAEREREASKRNLEEFLGKFERIAKDESFDPRVREAAIEALELYSPFLRLYE